MACWVRFRLFNLPSRPHRRSQSIQMIQINLKNEINLKTSLMSRTGAIECKFFPSPEMNLSAESYLKMLILRSWRFAIVSSQESPLPSPRETGNNYKIANRAQFPSAFLSNIKQLQNCSQFSCFREESYHGAMTVTPPTMLQKCLPPSTPFPWLHRSFFPVDFPHLCRVTRTQQLCIVSVEIYVKRISWPPFPSSFFRTECVRRGSSEFSLWREAVGKREDNKNEKLLA